MCDVKVNSSVKGSVTDSATVEAVAVYEAAATGLAGTPDLGS